MMSRQFGTAVADEDAFHVEASHAEGRLAGFEVRQIPNMFAHDVRFRLEQLHVASE
jgi:hypothetical protein